MTNVILLIVSIIFFSIAIYLNASDELKYMDTIAVIIFAAAVNIETTIRDK